MLSRRGVLAGGLAFGAGGTGPPRQVGSALTRLSLCEASDLLAENRLSPVALTQACLDKIAAQDGAIGSFITVTAERALRAARTAEVELRAGRWRGPLHGVPVALKDNIDTAGVRTTAASEVLARHVPQKDAAVVSLLKRQGAILLGKLNMGEFAVSESVVSAWGPVRNPWDLSREAGGSSSGAAAAVAMGFCFGAVGTDTAGSIRMPAAHCGVAGLKPTYGLVDVRGVIPFMASLDHVGPIARTPSDCARLLSALTDQANDGAAFPQPAVRSLRVGVARSPFVEQSARAVVDRFERACGVIAGLTAGTRDVRIETPPVDVMALYVGEAIPFHRRFRSQRQSYQPSNRAKFDDPPGQDPAQAAAAYRAATAALASARLSASKLFQAVDLIILPTVPYTARRNEELLKAVDAGGGIEPSNTRVFDLLGLPAMSIPCGFGPDGLPVGLQVVGPPLAEARVLALAEAYERAAGWTACHPPGF